MSNSRYTLLYKNNSYNLEIVQNEGKYHLTGSVYLDDPGCTEITITDFYSSQDLSGLVNSWHHYAMAYDQENLMMFIDGKLDSVKKVSQTINYIKGRKHKSCYRYNFKRYNCWSLS